MINKMCFLLVSKFHLPSKKQGDTYIDAARHTTVVSGTIVKETGFNLKEMAAMQSTQGKIRNIGVNELWLSYHRQNQACQQPSQPTATASPSTQTHMLLKRLCDNKPQGSWWTHGSSYWLLIVLSSQTVSRTSYIIKYQKLENIF